MVGAGISLASGATNRFGSFNTGSSVSQPYLSFFGAFPSITLSSLGSGSKVSASYAYGLNRTLTGAPYSLQSHSTSFNLSKPLSPEWTIGFSESFLLSSDAATFNAFQRVSTDPASPFVFSPVSAKISARTNSFRASADYKISDRSSVAFNVSHALRGYGSGTGSASEALSNQQGYSGTISYAYQSGKREHWNVGYTASYFNFSKFDNVYSQGAHVGYSNEIGPDINLSINVGLTRSQSQSSTDKYTGYDSSIALSKAIRNKSFAVFYSQGSAETTGLGSVSDSRRAGVSFNRASRLVTFFADVSAFDSQGILGNKYSTRGIAAAASIGLPLSAGFYLEGGGNYQRYGNAAQFGFTEKRLNVSLRYNNPNIWRFAR